MRSCRFDMPSNRRLWTDFPFYTISNPHRPRNLSAVQRRRNGFDRIIWSRTYTRSYFDLQHDHPRFFVPSFDDSIICIIPDFGEHEWFLRVGSTAYALPRCNALSPQKSTRSCIPIQDNVRTRVLFTTVIAPVYHERLQIPKTMNTGEAVRWEKNVTYLASFTWNPTLYAT